MILFVFIALPAVVLVPRGHARATLEDARRHGRGRDRDRRAVGGAQPHDVREAHRARHRVRLGAARRQLRHHVLRRQARLLGRHAARSRTTRRTSRRRSSTSAPARRRSTTSSTTSRVSRWWSRPASGGCSSSTAVPERRVQPGRRTARRRHVVGDPHRLLPAPAVRRSAASSCSGAAASRSSRSSPSSPRPPSPWRSSFGITRYRAPVDAIMPVARRDRDRRRASAGGPPAPAGRTHRSRRRPVTDPAPAPPRPANVGDVTLTDRPRRRTSAAERDRRPTGPRSRPPFRRLAPGGHLRGRGASVRFLNVFWWRPTTNRPGYHGYKLGGDAFYYHWQANALAKGAWFVDPFVWHFLDGTRAPERDPPAALRHLPLAVVARSASTPSPGTGSPRASSASPRSW